MLGHGTQQALARVVASKPSFSAFVRRREDFIDLRFDFFNLKLDTSSPAAPRLVFINRAQPAIIAIAFPGQNIAEQAFFEAAPEFNDPTVDPLQPPGSVQALIAHESRLAFQLPANTSIPYTIDGLLSWFGLAPSLVPVAGTKPPPGATSKQMMRLPFTSETSLELPWRLIVSPNEKSAWAHALGPVTHAGRTELWHTRLGVRSGTVVDEHSPANRTLRAVWALDPAFPTHLAAHDPDFRVPDTPSPFRMSLTERDRYDIARLTSDYTDATLTPAPVAVTRLMLSTMGAFLDVRGEWKPPIRGQGITLEEWRHKGTLGRDHYVRIVRRGYLYPFAIPAVLIKVTERKFGPIPNFTGSQDRAAYLRQRYFILIRQPDKDYGGLATGEPHGGRGFPFTHVKFTTLISPSLQPPKSFDSSVGGDTDVFQPMLGPSLPFVFHVIGTDWAADNVEFTTPVLFVTDSIAFIGSRMAKLQSDYLASPASVRTALIQGKSVALATSHKPGDTSIEAKSMLWGAEAPAAANGYPPEQPPFYPTMAEADVRIGAAEQVSGNTVQPTVEYFPPYVLDGFSGGDVFLQLTGGATTPLSFSTDRSGGVAAPNFDIGGVSRTLGPIGDLTGVAGGKFDPTMFLGDAKLLGGISLKDIVQAVTLASGTDAPDAALKIKNNKLPGEVITHLHWKTTNLNSAPAPPPDDVFRPDSGASFSLEATITTVTAHPDQSTFTVMGELDAFTVNLIGSGAANFLSIQFHKLTFKSGKGQKSKVNVDIANVTYGGVLQFVKALEDIMSLGKGGPGIDVDNQGITAKFAIPIPTIAVGVFAISNLSFSAGVNIPFSGAPVRARFYFSERANPFQLQISMFAGGGFFGIAIGADGVELLEASLEFGASISLDLGVASGGVHIMAGIYFKFGHDDNLNADTCVLTGYLRIGGSLNVLGMVSLSVELYMSFTYENIGGKDKVIGQATLTLEVHVFVFSATISTTVQKHFGNAPGDPTFAQLMPPYPGDPNHSAAWTEYCHAFAPLPAA